MKTIDDQILLKPIPTLLDIDVGKKETNKPLSLIEVETKPKLLLNDSLLPTSENMLLEINVLNFMSLL